MSCLHLLRIDKGQPSIFIRDNRPDSLLKTMTENDKVKSNLYQESKVMVTLFWLVDEPREIHVCEYSAGG